MTGFYWEMVVEVMNSLMKLIVSGGVLNVSIKSVFVLLINRVMIDTFGIVIRYSYYLALLMNIFQADISAFTQKRIFT